MTCQLVIFRAIFFFFFSSPPPPPPTLDLKKKSHKSTYKKNLALSVIIIFDPALLADHHRLINNMTYQAI